MDSENLIANKKEGFPEETTDDIFVINSSFTDDKDLNLREHAPPMTYLLKNVPRYGKKGFRTIDIKLTCVAALKEYIALGSNVGIVYLYNRKEHNMLRLRSEGYTGPITCIQMCKSVDYMIAAGTKDGRIFCHQIPRIFQGKKQEAAVIRGIHKESITCLEWSQNAEKIFSGDADGVVVCTIIQYGEKIYSSSQTLVQESYPIVQLSYSYRKLLIGSTFRSVIYSPSTGNEIQQIGQRDRRDLGKYGVTFFPLHSSLYEYILYAARPNYHLWKCDSAGKVLETILLKETIKDSLSSIPMLQIPQQPGSQRENVGLGLLHVYAEKYLVSWNETSLVIINPHRKTIAGSCWDLTNIIDLSICEDEIFILQDFHLIRLATQPEIIKNLPDTEEDNLLKVLVNPFKQLETSWKNLNIFEKDVLDKSEKDNNIFGWLKKSASNTSSSSEVSKDNKTLPNPNCLNDTVLESKESNYKIVSAESNTEETHKIDEKNYVLKQEMNNVELSPSNTGKQLDSFKIAFSHIKIDETDEIVCTKTKKVKKKRKQMKGVKEVMSSSTSSLEHSMLFENETSMANTLTSSHSEEILNKKFEQSTLLESEAAGVASAVTASCPEEILNKKIEQSMLLENETMEITNMLTVSCPEETLNKPDSITMTVTESNKETQTIELDNRSTEIRVENNTSIYNPEPNIPLETNVDSILDIILSRYETKEKKQIKIENKTEEKSDTLNFLEHIETDSVDTVNCSKEITTKPAKTKLAKLKIDAKFSNSSIQSPEYNVYARSTSITDTNLETIDKSELLITESTLNNSSDDDEFNSKILEYPDIWARDRFPSAVLSLAVCNDFLCCVDNKNIVYYSNLSGAISWKIIDRDVTQIAVSPTGKVIWVLRKELAYAGMVTKNIGTHGINWMKVANDIQCIALGRNYAWYVKINGELHVQQNAFTSLSHCVSKTVAFPHPINNVACCDDVVCVITNKGKLFCRIGITDYRPEGLCWQEIGLGQRIVVNMAIGVNVLWIIDHLGNVWFQYDISEVVESKHESHNWWQVDMSELLFEDSHRSLQRKNAVAASVLSPVVVLPANLVFLSANHKPCIGACEKGVWYCESLGRYIFSNKREIIGHSWRKVILKATSASFSWKYISASGRSFKKGVLWGMLNNSDFLCFAGIEQTPTFVYAPSTCNKICCITAASEALWVLTSQGDIYVRNGISHLHPEGTHWVKLNLTQLTNRLVHISCGDNVVWGCDCNGTVFLRVGSLKAPTGQSLHQAWLALDVNMHEAEIRGQHPSSYGSNPSPQLHISKIYTGQNNYMLWAIDKKNNVYVREGIFPELPVGTGWVYVKGIQAKELCIGGTYVWAVTLNNDIYCRYGITDKNYIGDYWKKLPGNISSLSATSHCRLWGIGPDQILYEHRMHVLNHQKERNVIETSKKQEDGWELL